jgi:hypothetical protein
MAQDTSLVNGVSAESISPVVEAMFEMIVGCGIGFYYCWQESLVMLGIAPFLIVGGMLQIAF